MNKMIISDTSCLIALDNIGLLDILNKLYHKIHLTSEVFIEFGKELPDWFILVEAEDSGLKTILNKSLDKGEASAIAFALESNNPVLIIDELKGRKIARYYGLEIIGTLGILALAGKKGIISDFPGVIKKLVDNGFRVSEHLIEKLIRQYGNS